MHDEAEQEKPAVRGWRAPRRAVKDAAVAFAVYYVLAAVIETSVEHFAQAKKLSWDMLVLDWKKVLGIVVLSIVWAGLRILQNHLALLKQTSSFIASLTQDLVNRILNGVQEMLGRTGGQVLRETLIEAVVSEGARAEAPRIAFHTFALAFLKELRSFNEALAPAVAVLAHHRLATFKTMVANLKNDQAFDSTIEGKVQVEMSEALAEHAVRIVFFDPKTYADINHNWSPSFKVFIDALGQKQRAEKIQYLLHDEQVASRPEGDQKLMAYARRMKGAGFKVFIVPKRSLSEVATNVNVGRRLEVYDGDAAMKVESRGDYSTADRPKKDISITLRSVKEDSELAAFLNALQTHAPRNHV